MATQVRFDNVITVNFFSPAAAAAPPSKRKFEILLRRLNPAKKEAVLEKIRTLTDKERIFTDIIELAKTRDYVRFSKLFLDPDFDYYALAAVEQNCITPLQFGTLMFVRAGLCSGVKIEDIQVIPLFDGNAASARAWHSIKQTFVSKEGRSIMEDRELSCFFEHMRLQPVSEQSFVIIPDVRQLPESLRNISVRLNLNAYFNAFCGLYIDQKSMRVIPSMGMVKALLDATGDDGFTFEVAIDDATEEEIRLTSLHENARDLRIHSSIASAPKNADGFDSPPIDYIFHEICHLFVSRHIPKLMRKFMNELAPVVNPSRFSSRPAKQAAWEIYTTLIDLDIGLYRPDNLGKSVENQIHIVIVYVLDVLLPARKPYYIFPQEKLTNEEQKECEWISGELKEKIRGLFAVWRLYKLNYKNFDEITDYFDQLDLQLQQQIGAAFVEFEEFVNFSTLCTIPRGRFNQLSPRQIIELTDVARTSSLGLVRALQAGKSVAEILDRLRVI
jgi:hypothetical protein